mmetsp:Transcript_1507/g.3385  ORF Transcript_1507/g.3385 Transcript_1507/m.3385 type:complete len:217 (-) Transcript_1507:226-876(-)
MVFPKLAFQKLEELDLHVGAGSELAVAALRGEALVHAGVGGGGGQEALPEPRPRPEHRDDAVGLPVALLQHVGLLVLQREEAVAVGHEVVDEVDAADPELRRQLFPVDDPRGSVGEGDAVPVDGPRDRKRGHPDRAGAEVGTEHVSCLRQERRADESKGLEPLVHVLFGVNQVPGYVPLGHRGAARHLEQLQPRVRATYVAAKHPVKLCRVHTDVT